MAAQDVAPETPQNEAAVSQEAVSDELAFPYIGQWNRLTSTTNWEKGRIICQWREAMIDGGAPITEYSDEAWAQLVGGVTSQHAGRLRRVHQHFGEVWDQYEGLYWSHFQAALDWEDAEMWLEGSLQNDWSVSQMRGKRWETLGTPPEDQQAAASLEATEADAEANTEANTDADAEDSESATDIAAASAAKDAGDPANPSTTTAVKPRVGDSDEALPAAKILGNSDALATEPAAKRMRLNVDVESLPDDIAEAFESFKLAIIAHRRENWRDTTPESVIECLDALKELALAEAE